ncbi:MAG: hypothetical protein ACOC0F_01125 [archaeon]
MTASVIAIGATLFAAGAIVLAIGRLVERGRTAIVELLWALAFSAFVAQRFAIDLLGVGEGLQDSGVLSIVVLAFGATAIVIEYRQTGTILGAFGG